MKAIATTKKRPREVQEARNEIRRKGWNQKSAALLIGVSRQHLNWVLNGHRQSKRILNALKELPENPRPA
jgi:transcriptional regulator with XRE-family HTH domain